MEIEDDIVIVGAGIAGLATSLGLHRLGIRSLVLESSDKLRITGFALSLWTNAWRALDALGIGDSLRQHYLQIPKFQVMTSSERASDQEGKEFQIMTSSERASDQEGKDSRDYESRCVRRQELLECLQRELPHGTIRYSSKVVSIEDSAHHKLKLVHLADGSIIKTKVVIGCDGVNSVVAKWLGLEKTVNSGRSAIRGLVEYPDGHNFKPRFHVQFADGVRYGFLPCDDKCLYWFCSFNSSLQHDEDLEDNPAKMKQFVLSKITKVPQQSSSVVEMTNLDRISYSQLKLRLPWNVLLGNIAKGNVCVAGDALHPMTPDIGQGGCSALEDGVVLARCLGEAFLEKKERKETKEEEEYENIKKGLEKYAKERRWRCFSLISAAYVVGFIQQSNWKVMSFLREKFLLGVTLWARRKMADFNCGGLNFS